MKKAFGFKTLGIAVVALLGCLLVIGWLLPAREQPEPEPVAEKAGDPAFRVRVIVPPIGRALFGILPAWIEDRLEGAAPRELLFEQKSPGAEVLAAGPGRLELRSADGWEVAIEADGEGKIAPTTRVTFPIYLGERHVKLICRPAEPAVGRFRSQPTSDGKVSGSFRIEVGNCKNATSGKNVAWPAAPLVLSGSFVALPGAPTILPPG